MAKRVLITLLGLIVLVGILGGIKGLQIERMVAQGKQFVPPPETVTTVRVQAESWEAALTAVGSLVAVQGLTVSAEMSGKIVKIAFASGSKVQAGDILIQQDTASESAQLRAAESAAALAKINFDRSRKLLPQKVISQSDYDNAEAQYQQAVAQVDNLRAVIAKKTVRAPFAGRLGIRQVNLGQILNEGQPIVSLQTLDPIYVNFLLPQQQLSRVQPGFSVQVTTDTLPGRVIEGRITAINPQVDAATRNVEIQATVPNTAEQLRPGMFVKVSVVLPGRNRVLAIPSTAVLYAPYGDSVFIVEGRPEAPSGKPSLAVRQQFLRLGEKRGDFVAVLSGLEEGQTVVSTGVFKLRNGQSVVVDNSLVPEFKLAPKPQEG